MTETRLLIFIAVLVIMMSAEAVWSKRNRSIALASRWPANFGATVLGNVVIRLLLPVTATGLALTSAANGTGLFNVLAVPAIIAVPISLVLLDLLIYFQHRVLHAVPTLWRLHRMHHTDLELDASSALRFHPLELLLSMVIKLAAIAVLGIPAMAVLVFEILLSGLAIFNHANLSMPASVDALLRKLVVTPDMHRVHHSSIPIETNSNFGFCLSWWDRLFGTYTAQPRHGHQGMQIGLSDYREPKILRLDRMLLDPFD